MTNKTNGIVWSIETEGNSYADDLFCADSYVECVEYIKENREWFEQDYQIAKIELEDGCATYTHSIIAKDEVEADL